MELKKIVAIVRKDVLENVEHRLQQLGVPGVTIGQVKGYGEYADFFNRNLTRNARIEIFTAEDKVEGIVQTILDAARTGAEGNGLVAVEPLSRFWRVREKAEVGARDFE
jgi:nitrogen regulatory protein PII